MRDEPLLIGIDWGTSALRAYLLADGGTILARASQQWGVMATTGRDFAGTFHAAIDPWDAVHPGLPAIAAGMIGSTEGWVRAPYCACPAGLTELAANLVPIPVERDGTLHVVPGVEVRGRVPDVMRGEETQIIGAAAQLAGQQSDSLLVLPGTHSKWVDWRAERIAGFRTYMTGELYGLLAERSILGRPARAARDHGAFATETQANEAFDRAVGMIRDSGAQGGAALLFLTRSLVLSEALRPEQSLDFLSGLLIGEEVRSALPVADRHVAVVGEPALAARYRRALTAFGMEDSASIDDSAPAGLWRIACRAGLIASRAPRTAHMRAQ